MLKLRARTLQREARDARRFENTHQLWEAVERGEVTLPESAIKLLLRIGAIDERR